MSDISVYVDEAGDMGFTEKSSKFFTIGYAFIVDGSAEKENRAIKNVLKNINTITKSKIFEFKFSDNVPAVRKKFLNKISKLDVELGVFCISKDSVPPDLKKDKSAFYEFVVVDKIITHLVGDYVELHDRTNSIEFVLDKNLQHAARRAFDEYCQNKIQREVKKKNRGISLTSNMHHEDSKNIPMIQVADYVASATQHYVVHDEPTFYHMYSNKLKYRDKWDLNNKIRR